MPKKNGARHTRLYSYATESTRCKLHYACISLLGRFMLLLELTEMTCNCARICDNNL